CRQETSIHYGTLVGRSPCFVKVVTQIPSLAATDATVLVQGETGTGKELFARAIHEQSSRKDRAFVPVNCGALPDQLVENELFGHLKGAYTSAYTPQRGLVAEADGGTLFLDEVDTLSPSAQVKLLRFLQDRQYRPLGSSKSYYGDVRVIAATNTNLTKQVVDQRFRQDLFYRLNILSLTIPPLRERVQDIPLLASHLLAGHQPRGTAGQFRFSTESIRKLLGYHWPGNVREMEGIVQKASFLATSPILGPETIDLSVEPSHTNNHGHSTMRDEKFAAVRNFEQTYLAKLLRTSQGNVTHAARLAGKDRRAFQRLLQKHHLDRSQFSSGPSPSHTPY
ncbi:MAG TPA: sigma-54 dependent transcriptional regulator, partial [Nitrospira sp.]|nr:sigma-54 dependent transcriptional regulator [Nitrospira sp.]